MGERSSEKNQADAEARGDAVDLMEITGVIKWFDVAKGFGFIIPDNGMEDVLLHVTCLRRDGYQTVLEGTRVVCEIQKAGTRLPDIQNHLHGHLDRGSPIATAAGSHPCAGQAVQRT
jgi:cold shock CspA family protein